MEFDFKLSVNNVLRNQCGIWGYRRCIVIRCSCLFITCLSFFGSRNVSALEWIISRKFLNFHFNSGWIFSLILNVIFDSKWNNLMLPICVMSHKMSQEVIVKFTHENQTLILTDFAAGFCILLIFSTKQTCFTHICRIGFCRPRFSVTELLTVILIVLVNLDKVHKRSIAMLQYGSPKRPRFKQFSCDNKFHFFWRDLNDNLHEKLWSSCHNKLFNLSWGDSNDGWWVTLTLVLAGNCFSACVLRFVHASRLKYFFSDWKLIIGWQLSTSVICFQNEIINLCYEENKNWIWSHGIT